MDDLINHLKARFLPLKTRNDLTPLFDGIGNATYVLLGTASHGTSEYYRWRSDISKRLISQNGFSFVAVEGDWPDCYKLNRYVKWYPDGGDTVEEAFALFNKWPTWIWANKEMSEFIQWLREYNRNLPTDKMVGFYGLDIYSLWQSLNTVVNYLLRFDPEAIKIAKSAFKCFEPLKADVEKYALTEWLVPKACEEGVIEKLLGLRKEVLEYKGEDRESIFNIQQNALTAASAEKYYRTMLKGNFWAWNVRDEHMTQVLERLTQFYGESSKAIVWTHNLHAADAGYTDLKDTILISIGQLVRQKYGQDNVFLIGFGSYEGETIAAEEWGGPVKKLAVPPAQKRSWEEILHTARGGDKLLLCQEISILDGLEEPWWLRSIGTIYDPSQESGNYILAQLPYAFDAFIYFDRTKAIQPLPVKMAKDEDFPETFPSSV